jgi:uncharacterized membrane protein
VTIPPLPSLPPVPPHAPRLTLGQRLRNYFLTGIVVVGPVVITIYIALWVIGIADGWVKPLVPKSVLPENYLPFAIPGFGILVLLVALTLLGFLTANLVGRTLVDFGETLLARMPVVSGLYRSVKQIFETIFSKSDTSFRKVGLVEYPAPGCWSVVLISSPPQPDVAVGLPKGGEFAAVFLPCAPNPTTGFFFYVPREKVVEIPISVDDAFKIVMSLGLIRTDEEDPRRAAIEAQKRLAAPKKRGKKAEDEPASND